MAKRRWSELGTGQKIGTLALTSVQVSLAAAAYADLVRRPADQVNGHKAVWAAVIAVNFVGPLSYFRWGRIRVVPTV